MLCANCETEIKFALKYRFKSMNFDVFKEAIILEDISSLLFTYEPGYTLVIECDCGLPSVPLHILNEAQDKLCLNRIEFERR